jgi:hypothetical protein
MKLYATITSERASASQGGKSLEINIKNEKRENAVHIVVDTDMFGKVRVGVFYDITKAHEPLTSPDFLEEETKGNKQKGE